MLVSDARTRLSSAVLRGSSSYSDAEYDYALQSALQDLNLTARVNRLAVTTPMRAGDPRVSFRSICGFMPDRVVRAEVGFTSRGVWALATVYAVGDLVTVSGQQGYFVCTTANTASADNQPSTEDGGGFWVNQLWTHGTKIDLETYTTVARSLGDGSGAVWTPLIAWPYPWAWDQVCRGTPTKLAFYTQDEGFLFPVPTAAWKLVLLMESPLADWIPGEQNPDIDLPSIALYPTIDVGAAAYLEPATDEGQVRMRKWEMMKDQIRGWCIIDNGDEIKNPTAYLDHTDMRGGYGICGRGL